jgi:hypothetical protein
MPFPPQLTELLDIIKAASALVFVISFLWGSFKLISAVVVGFKSLKEFLDNTLPKMLSVLTQLEQYANAAMTNHLPHIEMYTENMAEGMKQQTADFRAFEVTQAQILTEVRSELRELREDIRSSRNAGS